MGGQKETPNEVAETDAKLDRAGSKEGATAADKADPAVAKLVELRDDVDGPQQK
jgi:hypothetical protein